MDGQGLVHVNHDKVVITRLGSGELLGVELGRLIQETDNGVEVCLSVRLGHVTPIQLAKQPSFGDMLEHTILA